MADRMFESEHLVIIEKCPYPIIRHRFALHIIPDDNNDLSKKDGKRYSRYL